MVKQLLRVGIEKLLGNTNSSVPLNSGQNLGSYRVKSMDKGIGYNRNSTININALSNNTTWPTFNYKSKK